MEILHIENLSFTYSGTNEPAVKDVNIRIEEGEFVLLCGKSGCGKSTLLKLIKKELRPYGNQEGTVFYNGNAITQIDDRISASQIGFILQNPESQIVTDTVWHELAFGLESLGLDKWIIRRRVAEMASYFGIEDWFHKKTDKLSGGQKQLLNLASVMVMHPKVLILDEPTAQLDPIAAVNFIGTLHKLNRELGLTVLVAEHRLEDVFPIADKVILMESGEVSYFGEPRKINSFFKDNPENVMRDALPSAMRIFALLEGEGECPITVRDGRKYITENYGNEIDTIKEVQFNHSKEKAVELREVFFRYKKELPDILRAATLSIYKNEHFCILGGNGTGKSTLLGLMAGLWKAYKGHIYIDGIPISQYKQNELYIKKVAMLPQNPQTLFLENTVDKDLEETCRTLKLKAEETERRIKQVADLLDIGHLLTKHPYDISGGEQQKAALAKLLLLSPSILLLDEPTKGLDAHAKQNVMKIIENLKCQGITVITVTHDIEFAAACADRVGLLFDGEFVSADIPNRFFAENNFYTTSANRISRGFYKNAILCEQVAELCLKNRKGGESG